MTDNRTTELCRMLDERGIEWEHEWLDYGEKIIWKSENGYSCFYETGRMDSVCLTVSGITPQQAIAATQGSEFNTDGLPVGLTISDDSRLLNWRGENYVKQSTLGSGTLTANDVLNAVYEHGARWQAIADELNATLGCSMTSATNIAPAIHDKATDEIRFTCECGRVTHLACPDPFELVSLYQHSMWATCETCLHVSKLELREVVE